MDVGAKVRSAWQDWSSRERRVLRTFAKSSPDAGLRCRCKVVLSLVQGNSAQEIQRAGLCSSSQVYRVASRFVEEGLTGLGDRRQDNGDAKVTEEYEWLLLIAVAKSPRDYGQRRPTWTQELLIKVMKKQTEIVVSVTTMSRLLKRHQVRLGRPKPIVGCPWKKARKSRRLRRIRRLIANLPPNEVVVYVDEVDIHLNPKIGPDYMLRGMQKSVLTPGKNEKRYLAGALNAKTGKLTWVEWERKTSDLFILLLWRLQKEYSEAACIHVVLDNYRIHSSQRTQLALASLGGKVRLHFLPPYCPDHNRIERVWKDLHDNVTRNHCCRTMDELMKEVHTDLRHRSKVLQRRYARRPAA
jgi:transposase